MPTKKQRRRQQKSRRHDYEYVYVDDEGNEVEVDPAELRAKKENGKPETHARAGASNRSSRTRQRVIEPPSWRRAAKRAAIWGPLLAVAMLILNGSRDPVQWIPSAVLLILFFVPISYFTDSIAYRLYRKRIERSEAPKAR
jgi:hypothetical protein